MFRVGRVLGQDGITMWATADETGQVYLCVRRGFMQPLTCLPVDDLDSARAYLSGIVRSAGIER